MRFISLICAAVAAHGQQYDDDDLTFMRQLSSHNGSNATQQQSNNNNQQQSSSNNGSNATQQQSNNNGNQQSSSNNNTNTQPDGGNNGQTVTGAGATVTVNGTNYSDVTVTVNFSVAMVPPVTVPADSRRLRRLTAGQTAAYNYFCSAFSLTASLTACNAMTTTQIGTGKPFANLAECHVTLANKVAGTNCAQTSTGKGTCIENPASVSSRHRACTQHVRPTGVVTADTAFTYKSDSTFTFPAAVVSTAAATLAADVQTAKTAATAQLATGQTTNMLKAFTVVAAQAIANDATAAAAVNLTAAFGMSQSALQALTIGTTDVNTYATTGTSTALDTAVTAVVAAVPSLATVTVDNGVVTPAATSSASVVSVLSGALLAVASMLMM